MFPVTEKATLVAVVVVVVSLFLPGMMPPVLPRRIVRPYYGWRSTSFTALPTRAVEFPGRSRPASSLMPLLVPVRFPRSSPIAPADSSFLSMTLGGARRHQSETGAESTTAGALSDDEAAYEAAYEALVAGGSDGGTGFAQQGTDAADSSDAAAVPRHDGLRTTGGSAASQDGPAPAAAVLTFVDEVHQMDRSMVDAAEAASFGSRAARRRSDAPSPSSVTTTREGNGNGKGRSGRLVRVHAESEADLRMVVDATGAAVTQLSDDECTAAEAVMAHVRVLLMDSRDARTTLPLPRVKQTLPESVRLAVQATRFRTLVALLRAYSAMTQATYTRRAASENVDDEVSVRPQPATIGGCEISGDGYRVGLRGSMTPAERAPPLFSPISPSAATSQALAERRDVWEVDIGIDDDDNGATAAAVATDPMTIEGDSAVTTMDLTSADLVVPPSAPEQQVALLQHYRGEGMLPVAPPVPPPQPRGPRPPPKVPSPLGLRVVAKTPPPLKGAMAVPVRSATAAAAGQAGGTGVTGRIAGGSVAILRRRPTLQEGLATLVEIIPTTWTALTRIRMTEACRQTFGPGFTLAKVLQLHHTHVEARLVKSAAEVRLRETCAHPRRGAADALYAASVGAAAPRPSPKVLPPPPLAVAAAPPAPILDGPAVRHTITTSTRQPPRDAKHAMAFVRALTSSVVGTAGDGSNDGRLLADVQLDELVSRESARRRVDVSGGQLTAELMASNGGRRLQLLESAHAAMGMEPGSMQMGPNEEEVATFLMSFFASFPDIFFVRGDCVSTPGRRSVYLRPLSVAPGAAFEHAEEEAAAAADPLPSSVLVALAAAVTAGVPRHLVNGVLPKLPPDVMASILSWFSSLPQDVRMAAASRWCQPRAPTATSILSSASADPVVVDTSILAIATTTVLLRHGKMFLVRGTHPGLLPPTPSMSRAMSPMTLANGLHTWTVQKFTGDPDLDDVAHFAAAEVVAAITRLTTPSGPRDFTLDAIRAELAPSIRPLFTDAEVVRRFLKFHPKFFVVSGDASSYVVGRASMFRKA